MNQKDVERQLTEQFLTYENFKDAIQLKILKNDGIFMNLRDEFNVIEKRIYELERQMELTQKVLVAKNQGKHYKEDSKLEAKFSIFQDKNYINNDFQRERKREEYLQQQLQNVNRLFDLFQKNPSVFDEDPTSKGLIDSIIVLGQKVMSQLMPENNQQNNLRLKIMQNTGDNQIKINKHNTSNEQTDMIEAYSNSLNSQLQMLEDQLNKFRADYLQKFYMIQVNVEEIKEKLVTKDDIDQLLEAQYKASMQSFLDEDEKQKKELKKLIDEQNMKIKDLCIKQYSAENLQKQNIEKQFQEQIAGIISQLEDQQFYTMLIQDQKYQILENRLRDFQENLQTSMTEMTNTLSQLQTRINQISPLGQQQTVEFYPQGFAQKNQQNFQIKYPGPINKSQVHFKQQNTNVVLFNQKESIQSDNPPSLIQQQKGDFQIDQQKHQTPNLPQPAEVKNRAQTPIIFQQQNYDNFKYLKTFVGSLIYLHFCQSNQER